MPAVGRPWPSEYKNGDDGEFNNDDDDDNNDDDDDNNDDDDDNNDGSKRGKLERFVPCLSIQRPLTNCP